MNEVAFTIKQDSEFYAKYFKAYRNIYSAVRPIIEEAK